jgi:hypothetical protein
VEEVEQELDNNPMWHWAGSHYYDRLTARQQYNRSLSQSPRSGEDAVPQQNHEETPIPSLRWLDNDNSSLIDHVTAYIAANEAMEQEGCHRDEIEQEIAWRQGRQGSLNYYSETRAYKYIRDM